MSSFSHSGRMSDQVAVLTELTRVTEYTYAEAGVVDDRWLVAVGLSFAEGTLVIEVDPNSDEVAMRFVAFVALEHLVRCRHRTGRHSAARMGKLYRRTLPLALDADESAGLYRRRPNRTRTRTEHDHCSMGWGRFQIACGTSGCGLNPIHYIPRTSAVPDVARLTAP